MSLVINTNSIATVANHNLIKNQTNLKDSLARLSSGSKLIDSTEDVGGLAVSTKIKAAINRNIRAQQNVQNAISYLQVQDGAIANAVNVLDRLSELKTMSLDPTKNSLDLATYNSEFKELQKQLNNIYKEKFNEISLFDDHENLIAISNENGADGSVTISRSGLFNELAEADLTQKVITDSAYVGTTDTSYTSLTFTTPTFGKSATVILADGSTVAGSVNGSDITAAIKGINEALAAAGISSIKASEDSEGKLVISGSETFTVAETISGGYNAGNGLGYGADVAGTAQTYSGVAKAYSYNTLGNYNEGDVVTGTRADGTQESYLVSGATSITGTGQSFDEFAALAATTRLNNNLNPVAQVFREDDSAGVDITYNAGDVVYDDSNGRYYLTRGAAGDYSNASTSAANATSAIEFLSLGKSLPGLTDYDAYDSSKSYYLDDIVSYDGNLYVANKSITNGEGAPITNTDDWMRLNVAVTGNNNLLNEDKDIFDFSVGDLKEFIQTGAVSRATNGAQTQRLNTSLELLRTNHTNLTAANSRLADVDVATESTVFARNNILVQASASMLSQANASLNIALSLLQ